MPKSQKNFNTLTNFVASLYLKILISLEDDIYTYIELNFLTAIFFLLNSSLAGGKKTLFSKDNAEF